MAKRMVGVLAVVGLVALLQGCGGSSSGSNDAAGGSGTFSCDVAAPTHGCTEWSWSGGAYPTGPLSTACTQAGGTAGTGCSHTNSSGGCRLTQTNGGFTLLNTFWYYAPMTVAQVQAACTPISGATYVAP
ncbi:MAG: hypothetical protein HZB56_14220 [Deltaproteobacteria bacterium]|nr:hypothetical protein [Deltaproteobacteria bacterium]